MFAVKCSYITYWLLTDSWIKVRSSVSSGSFNVFIVVTALNASLAVVGCDEYTDLCTRFHITAFPTILLFTPPTIDNPVSLTGTLDSTHLLKALVQSSNEPGDIPLVKQYNLKFSVDDVFLFLG